MATIKIMQVKSRANRPIDQKRTLNSLGLTKMNQVVEHEPMTSTSVVTVSAISLSGIFAGGVSQL